MSEATLALVTLLARAGRRLEAQRMMRDWEKIKGNAYVFPLILAIAYSHLGEISMALEAIGKLVEERHESCLFIRTAPYLEPLLGRPEFYRILKNAGLPDADASAQSASV